MAGDGTSTNFWTNHWLHGRAVMELAPNLTVLVSKRTLNRITVQEALTDRMWVSDIRGALFIFALVEYLELWETLDVTQLQHDTPDQYFGNKRLLTTANLFH
ncbi:hypothetical protein SETIT_5G189200v2 [Setaria italica]|uniref:Uncharacterized protein n=1 Tax=Setaria italica TaxID=4555 RepID=A0A368R6M9_SETIT|nr:hypothetical protein SETIT_5G189200v2 [Setaria italica]